MQTEQEDQSLMERLCIAICIVAIGVGAALTMKHGQEATACLKSQVRTVALTGSNQ